MVIFFQSSSIIASYVDDYPLLEALNSRTLSVVEELLKKGVDPDEIGKDGTTILFRNSYFKNIEKSELLLKYGANPNTRSRHGAYPTPLWIAGES